MSLLKAGFHKPLAFALLLALTVSLLASVSHAAVTGTVQGTIRGESGQPLQSVRVSLIGAGAPIITKTDKSGFFVFTGVQPGNYTIQSEYVTFKTATQAVSVTPDIVSNLTFTLEKTVRTGVTRSTIAPTRRNETATSTAISAKDEQREKSQPNNLYQSTGLLNFKPGVTTDAGQYPHLRGADGNQVQWMVDGINIRDPITNQFATNLVTVGIGRTNLVTAGATADYGGAVGGFLNQTTINGRDLAPGREFGGFTEYTAGPSKKWEYSGTNTQFGGVLLNNKLDYAFAGVLFKTKYGDNTQLGNLASSHDESAKFNYFADPNNTFTAYFSHGAENYNSFQTSTNSTFFDPDKTLTDPTTGRKYYSSRDLGTPFNDHNVQTYNLDHFTYKHGFTPASYLQYRIYSLHQAIPNHEEATSGFYNFDRTNVTGNQLDYFNQISQQNILRAGMEYLDSKGSFRRQIVNVQTGALSADNPRYSDRVYPAYPVDFAAYASDSLRAADNKTTLDLGLRFSSTNFKLTSSKYAASIGKATPGGYTTKSVDPRLGLNYSPSPDLTFRSSFSVNSQRPDMRRVERVGPEDVGAIGTSIDPNPLAQSRSAYNAQGFSRVKLSHSQDFDLGVEKAFTMSGPVAGQYSVSLTGFKKHEYGLAYLNALNYTGTTAPSPQRFDNEGTSHSSGFELFFRKLQRHDSDWNGYLSYTNQVVRTNSSLYDTAYDPYFQFYFGADPNFGDSATDPTILPGQDLRRLNHTEFAPSWDQRHTVAIVANKRFTKLVESSFILDAGSGLPFYSGATLDGAFRAGGGQFGELSTVLNGAADLAEVPVVLADNRSLPPINPVVGYASWHYKISINNTFYLTRDTSVFLNVDNIFDKKTALNYATGTFSGEPYFNPPSAQFPQGQEVFKYQSKLTPVFVTFGFRQRF